LTAFATALNGQGVNLGQALRDASSYLKVVAPRLPTVQADLRLVDPVSRHLAQATPDLLGTLSNSTVTGQTISDQAAQLHNLLAQGTTTSAQFAGLLEQIQAGFTSLVNQSGPLLSDVTQNPNELSLTLQGLGQFASAVASAESHGPFLSVSAALPVPNISAGVEAALGYNNPASIAQALGVAVNPLTYTSANCPQYPGAINRYCGTGGSPAAAPVQAASAGAFAPAASSSSSVAAASAPSTNSGSGTSSAGT
jgi:ABC-type transporter Mla subunit MlaD